MTKKSKELAQEVKELVLEELKDKMSDIKEKFKNTLQDLKEKNEPYKEDLNELVNNFEDFIKKHPLLSVSGAFAIGVLISKLSK